MGHQTFLGLGLLACLTLTSCVEGSPKVQARVKCPNQAIYYRLQCYQPIYTSLSWDEAEIECQHLRSGSHLATFLNAAEERIVSTQIKRVSTITKAWIGMHALQEGQRLNWQWSDGTTFTPESYLWDNKAPSTKASTPHCISLANIQCPDADRWVQTTCGTRLPFICKYKASF